MPEDGAQVVLETVEEGPDGPIKRRVTLDPKAIASLLHASSQLRRRALHMPETTTGNQLTGAGGGPVATVSANVGNLKDYQDALQAALQVTPEQLDRLSRIEAVQDAVVEQRRPFVINDKDA